MCVHVFVNISVFFLHNNVFFSVVYALAIIISNLIRSVHTNFSVIGLIVLDVFAVSPSSL